VPILEALASEALVLDGAMGTRLAEAGLPFGECFDAANLERPDLVRRIHHEYLEAGARGVHTNTFGANRYRLARHHRESDLAAILEAGAALAREAAGGRAWVLGSLGPLGVPIEPLGRLEKAEARAAFREAAAILAPGVDALALETFGNLDELLEALAGVREACDLPVFAYLSVDASGRTLHGAQAEMCARALDRAGAEVIGLNCSTGPRAVLDTALRMMEWTSKPLAARPNAGIPREVEGRIFYENNADWFARFARRFLQAGGRVLGGCCGTTPEHVRAMVRAARAVHVQERSAAPPPAAESEARPRPLRPLPLEERSRFGRLLATSACPVSVELVPPRTPDTSRLVQAARRILDGGADLINLPDGPRASARVSNLAAAVILERETGAETLLHFCCRDRNLLGMQSDLMGAAALGLRNLLVVTGDPPYQGNYPDVTAVFDVDSIGLCNILDQLNHGLDIGGNEIGAQTHFVYGGALNHTALDPEREVSRLGWKIRAGVQFLITQPVFDRAALETFLERCRAELELPLPPVLAGIWPLRSLRNAEFLAAEVPGVSVPEEVLERIHRADRKGRAAEEGVALARELVQALAGTVQGYQIAAPFNRPEAAVEVLQAVAEVRPARTREARP